MRIIRAILVVTAARAIWVVDAVRRILTSVTTIGVRDAVRIVFVGIDVASEVALAVIKFWAVSRATVGVIKCVWWLRWRFG